MLVTAVRLVMRMFGFITVRLGIKLAAMELIVAGQLRRMKL